MTSVFARTAVFLAAFVWVCAPGIDHVAAGENVADLASHPGANCASRFVTSDGYNFADDESCSFAAVGDRQGAGLDPQLEALADNGGPTSTMLPSTTSPLVRAIDSTTGQARVVNGITTDQRGLPRANADGCDIGAVELQTVPLTNAPKFTG